MGDPSEYGASRLPFGEIAQKPAFERDDLEVVWWAGLSAV
jgi:hypothetical protein